ncbi:MAG: hypothetical protein Q9214_000585 [Letrouitia sp. 1 TL-2023]
MRPSAAYKPSLRMRSHLKKNIVLTLACRKGWDERSTQPQEAARLDQSLVGRRASGVARVTRDSRNAETGTRLDGAGVVDVENWDVAGLRCSTAANVAGAEGWNLAEDDGVDAATEHLHVSR